MKPRAGDRPCFDPYEVESFVLVSAFYAEQTRLATRELETALSKTRDRIEQSNRRLTESDLLVNALSVSILSQR